MPGIGDLYRVDLEAELRSSIPEGGSAAALYTALRYHFGWVDAAGHPFVSATGKRLRPILCLLVCEGYGGDYRNALPAAAAIELLHNFTLIHDDIEDRSDERHHRATVWRLWGEAQAINGGDALFCLSQLALQRLAERGLSSAKVLAAAAALNRACLRICEGQYMDVDFERRATVAEDAYMSMTADKTAALIGCSLELGALVAGAPARERKMMREVGESLGLAYQVQDDVLGVWGEPTVTGKPTADDIRSRKKTLPIVHALALAPLADRERMRALLAKPSLTEAEVVAVVGILEHAGSRIYAERLARRLSDETLAVLERSRLSQEARLAINDLIHSLLQRPS